MPCPCGYFGRNNEDCLCLFGERDRYLRRLSGPILDRIDLVAWVDPVSAPTLLAGRVAETSMVVRDRVAGARALRELPNARASLQSCVRRLNSGGRREVETGMGKLRGSARGVQQFVRVAATIADLDGSPAVRVSHVQEALLLCAPRAQGSTRFGHAGI